MAQPEITTVNIGLPSPPGAGISASQYSAITAVTTTIHQGSGTPEGVVAANVGDLYQRSDGDALTALYVKAFGSSSTGWVPVDGFARDRWESGFHADVAAGTYSVKGMGAVTTNGTITNGTLASGAYNRHTTGSVSGNVSQVHTDAIVWPTWGVDAVFHVRPHDLTNVRIWVGLFSADPSGTSTITTSHAAFRYDDSTDSVWKCEVADGTTRNSANAGAAPAVDTDTLLRINADSTRVRFYVDNRLSQTITTNLPADTTALSAYVSITTRAAAAKRLDCGFGNFLSK